MIGKEETMKKGIVVLLTMLVLFSAIAVPGDAWAWRGGWHPGGGSVSTRSRPFRLHHLSVDLRPQRSRPTGSRFVERGLHLQDRVDVGARRQAGAHRVHRQVRGTQSAPLPRALGPLGGATDPIREAALDAHGR